MTDETVETGAETEADATTVATAEPGDGNGAGSPSRRKFIVGGAVVAAAAAGGAYAWVQSGKEPKPAKSVRAKKVGALPLDDPGSGKWGDAPTARVELDAQLVTMPTRAMAYQPTADVKALHDGKTIAFRIEWEDPDVDDLTVGVDRFRDACAVLLVPSADFALRTMGSASVAATLLHWKADWQRDLDEGRSDVRAQFPNASFDYYPPLTAGHGENMTIDDYEKAEATFWLPGLHVGNPLSAKTRTTPVEKLMAKGFGTAATLATQDALGRGVHDDGKWRVVLAKPLAAADSDEIALSPGGDYGMAVAVWAGIEKDGGSRKSPSKEVLTLHLDG